MLPHLRPGGHHRFPGGVLARHDSTRGGLDPREMGCAYVIPSLREGRDLSGPRDTCVQGGVHPRPHVQVLRPGREQRSLPQPSGHAGVHSREDRHRVRRHPVQLDPRPRRTHGDDKGGVLRELLRDDRRAPEGEPPDQGIPLCHSPRLHQEDDA